MTQLSERGNIAALLDTVLFIPCLIVASVPMFAAVLATAIGHQLEDLPVGAAICLGRGLGLFHLTNAAAAPHEMTVVVVRGRGERQRASSRPRAA